MATFTITTPVNIDSLTGKAGGDVYNINGGYLTVDQDSRYGVQQSTSSTLGNITLSSTLGGTIEFNATNVRLIPYNTGSSTVPAAGTTILQGSASGVLIGVYSALNVAPTTAGAAMPAAGYIKIRQWNGVAFTSGALTGISASSTGADIVGWIEIVGDEAGLCTVNRLNTFKVRGEWFDLGTTDGNRATTYQIPSNGVNQYHAGVWVETASGSGTYEFYPCAGSRSALAADIATDGVRGKYCWISTAGLLRFGHDGTDSTGGYIPPANRKIRIPNIFFANCTTAARTANALPNATLGTRYEFATTGGGVLDIDKGSFSWYFNCNQVYSMNLSNTGVCTAIVATEVAAPLTWTQVGVGQEAANTQFALTLNLSFAGGTISNCKFARAAQGSNGNYVATMTDISGFTFTDTGFVSLTKAANATTGSLTLVRGVDCTFTNTLLGGGRFFMTTCTNVSVYDTVYYDHPAVNTLSAIPMYVYDIGSKCDTIMLDGVTFGGLYLTQPYNGILQLGSAGCANIFLRNLGTYASPLSLGSPRVDDAAWTRVTTTATVTSNNHGFLVNDTIYVVVSSDTAAITVAAKTITAVTTNTFQFACTNGGAAAGTLCYFGTKCANLFVLATSAAARNVKIQRCYCPHTRTNLYTTDNSSKDVYLANVFSDYLNAPLIAMLNGIFRNVSGTPPLTAQSSVYGTHWFNGYVCDVADNTTSQSWSRSGTTVTVISSGHRLRTGMLIAITTSSDTSAVPYGSYSVTALSSSTFTITGVAAGGTSGTLSYRVANGRIGLLMNEASADTTDRYTIDAGNPAFTSTGGLYMPTVGDQVTFVTPEYILGQGSSFPIFEAVMAGGTLANYDITYAIDKNDGNGYSSFKNLSYPRTGAGGSGSSTTVTMTDTTGVEVDDYVFGTNISYGAQVVSIDSGTAITVSIANKGTVSGTLRFNHLPAETSLGPDTGIKMKWRIKTSTTNSAAITSLYIQAESTVLGRSYQYVLDTATLTLTDVVSGSDVVILQPGTSTEYENVNSLSGTAHAFEYDVSAVAAVDVCVYKQGYIPWTLRNYSVGSAGASVPVQQVADRNFQNP